jgi:hypothetical protein
MARMGTVLHAPRVVVLPAAVCRKDWDLTLKVHLSWGASKQCVAMAGWNPSIWMLTRFRQAGERRVGCGAEWTSPGTMDPATAKPPSRWDRTRVTRVARWPGMLPATGRSWVASP